MSEHVKTKQQYLNSKRYFQAFCDTIWDCNMSEGSNEVYLEMCETADPQI
jgi:hypothetical protein